jgi:AcrR family transcriptional regulator
MSQKFLSVSEAADFAGVNVRSIYYHISTSKKLYPIVEDSIWKVSIQNLLELYPPRNAGKKQKLKVSMETRESTIRNLLSQIEQELLAGNTYDAQRLFTASKRV